MLSWCQELTDKSANGTKEELVCATRHGDLLPQWILPCLQSCFSQDGNAVRLNPLTHQHSKFTSLHSKEMNIFFFHQSAVCWQYTHTASPSWALICILLNKQSWKWAQPAPSKDIPSKLLNCHTQLVFTRTLQELYYWQSLLKQGPCHKPSWRFASTLGALTKQPVIFPVLSTFLGITAMPHQHSSVCIQRKHWQHWMQHVFWCLMSLCSWPPAGLKLLWSCQKAAGNTTTNQKPPINQWITFLTQIMVSP